MTTPDTQTIASITFPLAGKKHSCRGTRSVFKKLGIIDYDLDCHDEDIVKVIDSGQKFTVSADGYFHSIPSISPEIYHILCKAIREVFPREYDVEELSGR